MEPDFWLKKWEDGQTGFHKTDVNPLLIKYLPHLQLEKGQSIVLPLCGKSIDLQYLHTLGYSVTGIELSPLAIEAFWKSQGSSPMTRDELGFPISYVGSLSLIQADLFRLHPSDLGPVHAVFDRAALIAMPRSMRSAYVSQIKTLAQGAPILLITLTYAENEMQGPPFSVSNDEVSALFEPDYIVECLESQEVISLNEGLRQRGLRQLIETVWLLTRSPLAC